MKKVDPQDKALLQAIRAGQKLQRRYALCIDMRDMWSRKAEEAAQQATKLKSILLRFEAKRKQPST